MNAQDTAQFLQHVLLMCMPRGIWHTLDATAEFSPTVLQSSGLNAFELETLILQQETHFSLSFGQATDLFEVAQAKICPLHLPLPYLSPTIPHQPHIGFWLLAT